MQRNAEKTEHPLNSINKEMGLHSNPGSSAEYSAHIILAPNG